MKISLRDRFALSADMSSTSFATLEFAAKFACIEFPSDPTAEDALRISAAAVAKARYIYADAMLEARKQGRKIVAMRDDAGFEYVIDGEIIAMLAEKGLDPFDPLSWDEVWPENGPYTPAYEDE